MLWNNLDLVDFGTLVKICFWICKAGIKLLIRVLCNRITLLPKKHIVIGRVNGFLVLTLSEEIIFRFDLLRFWSPKTRFNIKFFTLESCSNYVPKVYRNIIRLCSLLPENEVGAELSVLGCRLIDDYRVLSFIQLTQIGIRFWILNSFA